MADARPSAAVLVDQLHSLIDELQTVDLTGCSDSDLVDVAAETERAIARLSFAGDRQVVEATER
ncbi:HNH endonuclease, partial [Gordonia amicalis]|nr:HNH endonuclease [Gordonia amicalis]